MSFSSAVFWCSFLFKKKKKVPTCPAGCICESCRTYRNFSFCSNTLFVPSPSSRCDPATVNITDEMSKGSFGGVWKSVNPAEPPKKEASAKRCVDASCILLIPYLGFYFLFFCSVVQKIKKLNRQRHFLDMLARVYCSAVTERLAVFLFQETEELVCLEKEKDKGFIWERPCSLPRSPQCRLT